MSVRAECLFFEDATQRRFVKRKDIKIGLAFDEGKKQPVVVVGIKDNFIVLTSNAYFGLLKILKVKQEDAKKKYEGSMEKYVNWLNKLLQNQKRDGFLFVFRQGMITGILINDKYIFSPNVLVNEILKYAKIVDYEIGQFVQTFHIEQGKERFLCLSSDCGFLTPVIYKNPVFNEAKDLIRVDEISEFSGNMKDFFKCLSHFN